MRTKLSMLIASAMIAASSIALSGIAAAEDVTIVGPVTKIQMAADGKSATATLKDNKSGDAVNIQVTDDLTLDKFKDKRIVEGDEIRSKFDQKDSENSSKTFKKTAGC